MGRLKNRIWPKFLAVLIAGGLLVSCSEPGARENHKTAAVKEETDADGSVYYDESSGLQFAPEKTWEIFEAEEMKSHLGDTDPADGTYVMMAADSETGDNIILLYEDIPAISTPQMDEQEYLSQNSVLLQEAGFAPLGVPRTVQVGNFDYLLQEYVTETMGVMVRQFNLVRRIDNRMFGIIITGISGKSVEDYLEMFS